MHGYRILKTALTNFIDDTNVCLQVLEVLFKLPRITRNKIQDSKIEETVAKLKESEDERVVKQSTEILDIWSHLEVGYRIPRMKRDPNAVKAERMDRREPRARSRSRSKSPPVAAPSGPRSHMSRGNAHFYGGSRPPFRRPVPAFAALPPGWFSATAEGRLYYYNTAGQTTWTRPSEPTAAPALVQPMVKEMSHEEKLQQIINNITKNNTPQDRSPAVETPPSLSKEDVKKAKWASLSEEKKQKIYENTVCL
jgi:hypothetical protein